MDVRSSTTTDSRPVLNDAEAEVDRETQPPIADYALIGDCHGSALVSRAGSIDWCCLLRFDGDPVFFRLLDAKGGGCWDIRPERLVRIERRYCDSTAVLRTEFTTETGVLAVDDFMPLGRSRDASAHDYVSLCAPGWLARRFECLQGEVAFTTRSSTSTRCSIRRWRSGASGSSTPVTEAPVSKRSFAVQSR